MAKLRNRQSKEDSSGGYERLFGDGQLGSLLSKVHGTVIASGSELEGIIAEKVAKINNLNEFLQKEIMDEGVFLATKKQIKECAAFGESESEPDFIVFKRREGRQACHIVELKDGHVFDTKKLKLRKRLSKHLRRRTAPSSHIP